MNKPWSHAELTALKMSLSSKLEQTETDHPNSRPLPPLTEDECRGIFNAFMDTATTRRLTMDEAFLLGQLLAQFKMAVLAAGLGKRGRYFVLSEEMLQKMMGGGE